MKNTYSYAVLNHSCIKLDEKPFVLEHALEEYIVEHKDILSLSIEYSSPSIEGNEVHANNGRYDMLVQYNDDTYAIVEIKKGLLNLSALNQLQGYLRGKLPIIAENVFGILVGRDIDSETIAKIEQSDNVYAIVLKRYFDNKNEIVHTVIYSPINVTRNYDKYTLHDLQGRIINELGKGRLMYNIVKSYVEKFHPSYRKLCSEFQPRLAGRGARSKMPIIKENTLCPNDKLYIRYFKDELECSDKKVIVCNQWGIGNIQGMIDKAKELGMKVTSLNKQ